jgi:hypothetical protein
MKNISFKSNIKKKNFIFYFLNIKRNLNLSVYILLKEIIKKYYFIKN